jgi:hypothetical protein
MRNSFANAARTRSLLAVCLVALVAACSTGASAQRRDQRQGRIEIATPTGSYPYTIEGGPIPATSGTTSPTVQLIDLPPGDYTVKVQFPNGTLFDRTFTILPGKKTCIALNFRPKTVSIEHPKPTFCPYPVSISAPNSVNEGNTITFSSDVNYAGPSGLIYTWAVSPPTARIVSGAGTQTITVDTTGAGTDHVTAILVVDDGSGDRACRQRAQALTNIISIPKPLPPNPRRFGEFPSISFNEDKANFDNFAVELQGDPGAKGYIIVYNGRRSRPGRLSTLVSRSRDYMVNTRNIDASRIIVVNGGMRDTDTIELWVVPQGATPPMPTPQ